MSARHRPTSSMGDTAGQGLLVPDSPTVTAFPSPGIGTDANSGTGPSKLPHPVPLPNILRTPTPASVQALLDDPPVPGSPELRTPGSSYDPYEARNPRAALILRHALAYAVERCEADLLAWLVGLRGAEGAMLDDAAREMEDEDGWGLVGGAVAAACGRQDKEECVRVVVGRFGLDCGPRGGRDRGGWTPLHLASLISTAPLISFLLTRGASPRALTNRGLTPLDLIAGVHDRQEAALLLEQSSSVGPSYSAFVGGAPVGAPEDPMQGSLSQQRQAMLQRRRIVAAEKANRRARRQREKLVDAERAAWMRDRVRVVGVDAAVLLPPPDPRKRLSSDSGLGYISDDSDDDPLEDDDRESPTVARTFNESMLVFSLAQLPMILDIFISSRQPFCLPKADRALPANAIFLYARFAHYQCDQSWLEELIEGAVEKIEQGVYGNVEDLAYLAFWAYNTTLLLHLLRGDPGLRDACDELGFFGMMEELINAIHVFVIRLTERLIDAILDAAMLDYENLDEVGNVRFEGEWTLFRSFASGKKKVLPKASTIFAGASGASNGGINSSPSMPEYGSPSILGTLKDGMASLKTPSRQQSMHDLHSTTPSRPGIPDSPTTRSPLVASLSSPSMNVDDASPQTITDILTGVLLVLQVYDVNPALTVQAFSQVFYWIAAELFNRILTRKKYLCRSKAVQIRMNITALDDWVRSHGIPAKTATRHLEPVAQLLQWLQCSSQIKEFDTLVGTLQNMKALNPLQMRRAVRDYRYEVNEGKMSDECSQYLAQLQKDWDRRRVQMSMDAMKDQSRRSSTGNDECYTPIDSLFDGTTSLADFVPQTGPECLGELLDSRFMLPFALPEDNDYLVATPPNDAAYANLVPSSPFISDAATSRPPSRSSFSSSLPMGWALPSPSQLRRLPDGFFFWLKEQETAARWKSEPYLYDPLRAHFAPESAGTPHPSVAIPYLSPSSRTENDLTPLASAASYPFPLHAPASVTSPGIPSPGLRTSSSLDQLRAKASSANLHGTFETVKPAHKRQDSYELKPRPSSNTLKKPPPLVGRVEPVLTSPTPPPRRVSARKASQKSDMELSIIGRPGAEDAFIDSSQSPSSAGGRKWWKMGRQSSGVRDGSESATSEGGDMMTPSAPTGLAPWDRD